MDFRKKLNLDGPDGADVGEAEFLWGRFVKVSSVSWLEEKKFSIVPASEMGSSLSFVGDGIKDMLTGSDDPSNQLASLLTAEEGFFFAASSSGGVRATSYCEASDTETLSGDRVRVL